MAFLKESLAAVMVILVIEPVRPNQVVIFKSLCHCSSARSHCWGRKKSFCNKKPVTVEDTHLMWLSPTGEASFLAPTELWNSYSDIMRTVDFIPHLLHGNCISKISLHGQYAEEEQSSNVSTVETDQYCIKLEHMWTWVVILFFYLYFYIYVHYYYFYWHMHTRPVFSWVKSEIHCNGSQPTIVATPPHSGTVRIYRNNTSVSSEASFILCFSSLGKYDDANCN